VTQPTHADLNHTLHEVLTKLGAVEAKVEANGDNAREGFETVNHRLEAIEARVMAYDILKARIAAGVSVAVTMIGAVLAAFWWAMGEKVAHILKGPVP